MVRIKLPDKNFIGRNPNILRQKPDRNVWEKWIVFESKLLYNDTKMFIFAQAVKLLTGLFGGQ